jgi:DNA-binding MarR family transcriptional regulator
MDRRETTIRLSEYTDRLKTVEQIQKCLPATRGRVLKELLARKPEEEIARELNITLSTLRKHVSSLYDDFRELLPSKEKGQRNNKRELLNLFPEGSAHISSQNVEKLCYKEIEKDRGLLKIQAPRKGGKTSLLNKCLNHYSKEDRYKTVYVSFQRAESDDFESLEKLLQWFCINVAHRLEYEIPPESKKDKYPTFVEYWNSLSHGNNIMKCTNFIEELLNDNKDKIILLGLDDLGLTWEDRDGNEKKIGIANEFLSMLRSWREEAGSIEKWKRVRLILTYREDHSMGVRLSELVGTCIPLDEFNLDR